MIQINMKLTSKALLTHLVDYPDGHSYESLADDLGCGRATIGRHIARLKSAGYIAVIMQRGRALYIPTDAGRKAVQRKNVYDYQAASA